LPARAVGCGERCRSGGKIVCHRVERARDGGHFVAATIWRACRQIAGAESPGRIFNGPKPTPGGSEYRECRHESTDDERARGDERQRWRVTAEQKPERWARRDHDDAVDSPADDNRDRASRPKAGAVARSATAAAGSARPAGIARSRSSASLRAAIIEPPVLQAIACLRHERRRYRIVAVRNHAPIREDDEDLIPAAAILVAYELLDIDRRVALESAGKIARDCLRETVRRLTGPDGSRSRGDPHEEHGLYDEHGRQTEHEPESDSPVETARPLHR
jgi:hypothetical protein